MLPGKDEDPGEDSFDCRTGRLVSAGNPAREKTRRKRFGGPEVTAAPCPKPGRLESQLSQCAVAVSAFLGILKADWIAETEATRAYVARNQQLSARPHERHLPRAVAGTMEDPKAACERQPFAVSQMPVDAEALRPFARTQTRRTTIFWIRPRPGLIGLNGTSFPSKGTSAAYR